MHAPAWKGWFVLLKSLAIVLPLTLSVAATVVTAEEIDFVRDVRPIFEAHCVSCHGPSDQQGGLRLDYRDSVLRGGDSGPTYVAGDSAASTLITRVTAEEDERMPPPYEEDVQPLTEPQIETLRQWIDSGATWPDAVRGTGHIESDHWSYQPIVRGAPPAVKNRDWVRNSIDAYVLARLEAEGIEPSPEADRYTLIKRLYYDLVGLPPTPGEVDAFVNDTADDAYEQLVDRLLKSPHFGERWGRHWMDKARYADSDGYEKDRPRPNAWRYRDWVIDAVNRDMPFDQFTIEQMAGDLLPEATPMQRLATAFHRQTLTNTEGGTDQEEFRVAAIVDRIATTGSVWLGLTVACAQCHTHKYDKITQNEYYQLFAFFNNGDESETEVPISDEALAKYDVQLAEYRATSEALQAELQAMREALAPSFAGWEAEADAQLDKAAQNPPELIPLEVVSVNSSGGATFERLDDGSFLASGNNPDRDTLMLLAKSPTSDISSFRLETLTHESLPAKGPGRVAHGNFVLNELTAFAGPSEEVGEEHQITLASATADHSQDGFAVARAIDGDAKTGWAVGKEYGKDHWAEFTLADPIAVDADTVWVKLQLEQNHGRQHTIGRIRLLANTGDDPNAGMPENIVAALRTVAEDRTDEQRQQLLDYYVSTKPQGAELLARKEAHRKNELPRPTMQVRVIAHRNENPRTTQLLRRGDFLQPQGDGIVPDTLAVLHPLEARDPANPDRLDLARWLVDGRNPLTPRVAVNQMWSHLFGRGLVETMDDFGIRGEQPTHPKLLDWLALEFIDLGWSRKAMIRRIVTSATYRQASRHRPELAEVDPRNNLLYRQNRFRVEAEIIRDLHLAASGLLSEKIGGPSVFPPMTSDIASLSYAGNFKWEESQGEERYRRAMYTFFKRTAPHPNLITFDCPDSNTTCVQRQPSNTPLQALTTLNNIVFVEASQAMARRALEDAPPQDDARLTYIFRRCVAREPSEGELADATELLDTARQWYAEHEDAATELVGAYPAVDVSVDENAAWVATSRVFMNLDEFITRE